MPCLRVLSFTLVVLFANPVGAAVPPAEAARLDGPELTPLGAQRSANAEGTIPPWVGGITAWPADYTPGDHHPNPFADDTTLFTINAANAERYAGQLSEGQLALLRQYPSSWRMNVYPSRRSASYPRKVYQAVMANASSAEVIMEGFGGVRGARISSPFPIPRSGTEAIWNHLLRYRSGYVKRTNGEAAVHRFHGNYRLALYEEEFALPYAMMLDNPIKRQYANLIFAFKQKTISPPRLSGNGQLVLMPLTQSPAERRSSWRYSANLRRVFRNPFSGYDNEAPNSDGLRLTDEFDMYNGSPDRFVWKLLGKRELYIPYNAYELHSADRRVKELLQDHHIEPRYARYELHRVWVVEGTLKPGADHIYSRRVLYLDEDSWQVAVADSYDRNGKLWRVAEGHIVNYYEVPLVWTTLQVYQDLKARRYLVSGLDNRRNIYRFNNTASPREFSPNALTYYVR